jgi:hypothetical protein
MLTIPKCRNKRGEVLAKLYSTFISQNVKTRGLKLYTIYQRFEVNVKNVFTWLSDLSKLKMTHKINVNTSFSTFQITIEKLKRKVKRGKLNFQQ